ncbi:peptidylprolyl isomerase [Candidatus Peregrinibacteria bacterium]|nr:peptidylprolyl isomerase [Candidatus Peregrinibacteria bacterium]
MHKSHLFIIPLFALAFLLAGCGSSTGQNPASGLRITFDGTLLTGTHTVILHTTKGDITMELDATAAPKSVTNFITLAKNNYYNGLTFHRIIPGFMIQGGDPKGDGTGGYSIYGDAFGDEISAKFYGLDRQVIKDLAKGQPVPENIKNLTLKQFYEKQGYTYDNTLHSLPMGRGSLAMANRGPNTNGSQFFIIQAQKTPWLEGKHTIFGHVTSGMDVVDAITRAQRDSNDRPVTPVTYTVQVVD